MELVEAEPFRRYRFDNPGLRIVVGEDHGRSQQHQRGAFDGDIGVVVGDDWDEGDWTMTAQAEVVVLCPYELP